MYNDIHVYAQTYIIMIHQSPQTGNAMKQREINMILSNNEATRSKSDEGESFVNLRILDVGEYKISIWIYIGTYLQYDIQTHYYCV